MKLSELNPQTVAVETVRQIVAHLQRVAFSLAPAGELRFDATQSSTLQWDVQLLVGYAQRGLSATDWSLDADAVDCIQSVATALYSRAADDDWTIEGDVDPTAEVGIALLGAWARQKIAAGVPIKQREIAVLCNWTKQHAKNMIQRGEMRVNKNREITATEARRILKSRKVPGFAEK